MSRHVTMAEVAQRAAVHQTTVSLALRNDPRLSLATRQRIQQIAREMNYRPNPLISALISERKRKKVSGRGCVLAFLTSHEQRGEWSLSATNSILYKHLEEHALAHGYRLEEFWLREPGMTPARMRQILLHRGIRGIVVCPLQGMNHVLDFDFADFATVALGYTLRTPAIDHVATDYCSNVSLAIGQLLERGFRRIAFATSQSVNERVNHLSIGRFLAERHLHRRKLLPPLVSLHYSRAEVMAQVSKVRPDVILTSTSSDYKALSACVDETIGLTNLDCSKHGGESGISRSLDEEAEAAISYLTSRVERARFGLPLLPRSILIAGRWIEASVPAG